MKRDPHSPSPSLPELRERIDVLDTRLLSLLAERREIAELVIEAKNREHSNNTIRDETRERNLLRHRAEQGKALGLSPLFVTRVFHEIIAESVRVQQESLAPASINYSQSGPPRIAYRGIDGSYSYNASTSFFPSLTESPPSGATPCLFGFSTYEETLRAVEHGKCDYAVVPAETSHSGTVHEVFDLLLRSSVFIVGERKIRVNHCIVSLEDIELTDLTSLNCTALSVSECASFLNQNLRCSIQLFPDAAIAVRELRERGHRLHAAIASQETADMFGLNVIARDISDCALRYTRYLLIAREPVMMDSRIPAKTSLVINTVNTPGALVEAIMSFRANGINLSKIESRPLSDRPWEEMFYIDFLEHLNAPEAQSALMRLDSHVSFQKTLGCYPSYDIIPTQPEKKVMPPILTENTPKTAKIKRNKK